MHSHLKIYESCKEFDFFYCHQKAKESNIYAVEKELHGRPKNYGFKSTRAKIQQRQHNQLINGK